MKWKRTLCILLAAALWTVGAEDAGATKSSIQQQKAANEKELKNIQSQISSLEKQRNAISSEISGLNDDLTDTLLNIEVLKGDIADKEEEIAQAEVDLEEAQATEDHQYESMKMRIQYLYESGSDGYLELLLESGSVAELVNKVDYAEELQQYDRNLLDEYKAAKQAVIDLKTQLEEDREELLDAEGELEEEEARLEAVIAQKKETMADFDSQLSSARDKASAYQKKIKEQAAQIKKLQEEEAKAAAAAAAATSTGNAPTGSGTSSSGSSGSTPAVSGGSGTGAAIASYGLQFVGRPYVAGGNSLTNGTDCSGFVHLVHAHFGISTPRQSKSLLSGGRAVSDADRQPGDVICYPGHVGIYIGNNQIVHASTEKAGIKVSTWTYRSHLGIRRYW